MVKKSDNVVETTTFPEPLSLIDLNSMPEIKIVNSTGMTPTEDQFRVLSNINDWLDKWSWRDPYFLLAGYAGTGKTFCITEIAKSGRYEPDEVVFTAPTNKAVKVLRGYLNAAGLEDSPTATIYSLLKLVLQPDGEVKVLFRPDTNLDLSHIRLIVVDEASMVNSVLMKAINEVVECPVVFMGDPAQLPPVGEKLSPVWEIQTADILTQVLRHDNAILDFATRIRAVVDHPNPRIDIYEDAPVYIVNNRGFMPTIHDHIEEIVAGDAKVIAWRNIVVDKYNIDIRKKIFGAASSERWLPNDCIVATAQFKDLEDNIFMRTDEEARIDEVCIGIHPLHDFEVYNLLVTLENGRKATIRTLTETGAFRAKNRLEELAQIAKKEKLNKKANWAAFWTLKDAFHEIKHAYAITAHRSQGSSYNTVFVDAQDIMSNREQQEACRALYVAVTRARHAVYLT